MHSQCRIYYGTQACKSPIGSIGKAILKIETNNPQYYHEHQILVFLVSTRRKIDQKLIDRALAVARKEDIVAHKGVFVAVSGPNLETRAEYRFLRAIGADVVGMSTVPEVIVAAHCGLKVVGFSIVTDMCFPDSLEPANVPKIIAIANAAQPKLCKLVMGVLAGETAG